jgi:hypothetical protein
MRSRFGEAQRRRMVFLADAANEWDRLELVRSDARQKS